VHLDFIRFVRKNIILLTGLEWNIRLARQFKDQAGAGRKLVDFVVWTRFFLLTPAADLSAAREPQPPGERICIGPTVTIHVPR